MGVGGIITDIVMAPIGSWLLAKDLWLPFKFSSALLLLAIPLTLGMPETLGEKKPVPLADDSSGGPCDRHGLAESTRRSALRTISARIHHAYFKPTRQLRLALAILFVSVFASNGSGSLFVQYASKVLGWPIATTGYALSAHALAALVVLVGLAGASSSQRSKLLPDVGVVRAGAALLALGAGLVGVGGSRKSGGVLVTGELRSALW